MYWPLTHAVPLLFVGFFACEAVVIMSRDHLKLKAARQWKWGCEVSYIYFGYILYIVHWSGTEREPMLIVYYLILFKEYCHH